MYSLKSNKKQQKAKHCNFFFTVLIIIQKTNKNLQQIIKYKTIADYKLITKKDLLQHIGCFRSFSRTRKTMKK